MKRIMAMVFVAVFLLSDVESDAAPITWNFYGNVSHSYDPYSNPVTFNYGSGEIISNGDDVVGFFTFNPDIGSSPSSGKYLDMILGFGVTFYSKSGLDSVSFYGAADGPHDYPNTNVFNRIYSLNDAVRSGSVIDWYVAQASFVPGTIWTHSDSSTSILDQFAIDLSDFNRVFLDNNELPLQPLDLTGTNIVGIGNQINFLGEKAGNIYWTIDHFEMSNPVPEPATLLLLGTGLIGMAGVRRKLKK